LEHPTQYHGDPDGTLRPICWEPPEIVEIILQEISQKKYPTLWCVARFFIRDSSWQNDIRELHEEIEELLDSYVYGSLRKALADFTDANPGAGEPIEERAKRLRGAAA